MTARAPHPDLATAGLCRRKVGADCAMLLLVTLASVALMAVTALAEVAATSVPAFVAGTAPAERPAGAPKLDKYEKPHGWYSRALSGLQPPYPASLGFLEDQQGWFTPFDHPGMTGPYDIRNWHAR
jgi:hypothetical protein